MNCRYLLSLLIAATCSLNVQAASTESDRWFDIELLVFKRNVDIHKISEQLDQNNVYLKQRDRIEMLKIVHNKVQPYIEHMNTTQPIKCYTHNGNVFLDNDITNTIILLVVLGILFVLCILISLFCCGCFEK